MLTILSSGLTSVALFLLYTDEKMSFLDSLLFFTSYEYNILFITAVELPSSVVSPAGLNCPDKILATTPFPMNLANTNIVLDNGIRYLLTQSVTANTITIQNGGTTLSYPERRYDIILSRSIYRYRTGLFLIVLTYIIMPLSK